MPERPKEEDLKHMFRSELLRMAGLSDDEMLEDRLLNPSDEEFTQIIRSRLLPERVDSNTPKVIPMVDIEKFIEKGWEFVTTLPNDRVVVRLQSSAE